MCHVQFTIITVNNVYHFEGNMGAVDSCGIIESHETDTTINY